ncbi:dihydropteroate synthase [Kosmotoga arenicorallina S304]|uniref:Dihydropteroate synthase n=1 Tax=Kosmotoga arenicorallina S304 TaxID=1453497 RepID=A0A176K0V6_9BACT|nr:dihydropteroate synthase [Kosmotoga arenicorallina]OAA30095.1 dihydropteroate synthase [Kosmotoga arenicorallina S304]
MKLKARGRMLEREIAVMGIVNVTPDSFYEGSRASEIEKAVTMGLEMIREGADIIDVGGESSRPGADPVPVEEEINRVVPVIEAIRKVNSQVFISVDTYHAETAAEALKAGADIINDITGLGDKKMLKLVAESGAAVVIMHMKGTPKTMQKAPYYDDVVDEVNSFLLDRARVALREGIDPHSIILDPGIGFGKRLVDNIELLKNIGIFKAAGFPVLIGHSRKSFIGNILELPPKDRLEGTLAVSAFCFFKGADILRVHDVKENLRLLKTLMSLK